MSFVSGQYWDTLVSVWLSQSPYDLLNFTMLLSPVCSSSGHFRIDQGPPTDTTLLDASRRCDEIIGGYGRTWGPLATALPPTVDTGRDII